MSEAITKTEAINFKFPQLEIPEFELPDAFREAVVQWVDQGEKNVDTVIAAADEACGACGESWPTAAKCTVDALPSSRRRCTRTAM